MYEYNEFIFEILFEILYLGILNYNSEEFFIIPENMCIYIEIGNSLKEFLFKKIERIIPLGRVRLEVIKEIENRIDINNNDILFHRALFYLKGLYMIEYKNQKNYFLT